MSSEALRRAIKPLHLGRSTMKVWNRLPDRFVRSRAGLRLGHLIYDMFTRHTERYQSHSTFFMRNVPQMNVVLDLIQTLEQGASLKIASLGCSSGAELYSFLHVLRKSRPDLNASAQGIDIDEKIVDVARAGTYDPAASRNDNGLVPPIGIEDPEAYLATLGSLLERTEDGKMKVRDWVRKGTFWRVGDAASQVLADELGLQDIVFANNFLGPMEDKPATVCLRNITRVVRSGGILVLDGVDLDLKARVVPQLGLEPITANIEEIYHADPTKLGWPWARWSREPIDWTRTDRNIRYATIFRKA